MKKISLLFVSFVAFLGCSKKVDLAQVNQLNGYWQIEKVETAEGEKKDYPVNEDYDYFEVKSNTGFHKKVHWQPAGKFQVNATEEKIAISQKESAVVLTYTSAFDQRSETITEIDQKQLILETPEHTVFYYKRVEETPKQANGKTTK